MESIPDFGDSLTDFRFAMFQANKGVLQKVNINVGVWHAGHHSRTKGRHKAAEVALKRIEGSDKPRLSAGIRNRLSKSNQAA
jgi:hypothetical protein